MIAQILKIAGVGSEAEFYKKFPTEEAFMKVHGKAFKKAMSGARMKKADDGTQLTPIEPMKPLPMIGLEGVWKDYYEPLPKPGLTIPQAKAPGLDIAGAFDIGGKVIKGIQMLKEEKKALDSSRQWRGVSDVMLQASEIEPEIAERQYVRPEDNVSSGEDLFPVYGTHAKYGGRMRKANYGAILEQVGSDKLANLATELTGGESAGSMLGSAVGGAVSMIPGVGPVVGALASPVFSAIGNILDTNPEKIAANKRRTQANIDKMTGNKMFGGFRRINSASMEDGGELPMIAPMVKGDVFTPELMPMRDIFSTERSYSKRGITYSDEAKAIDREIAAIKAKKKLSTKDYGTIRTLEKNKEDLLGHQLDNMAEGGRIASIQSNGELSLARGYAKPISYNPYTEGGETIEFEGPSHEEGGMPARFGGDTAEVEGDEIAMITKDEKGERSLAILGNMVAPGYKGKKFKNVFKDIAKKEGKQNKIIDKSVNEMGLMAIETPIDKITFDTHKVIVEGANTKMKNFADEKERLESLQMAINDTAEERGLVASELAKGKVKKDRRANSYLAQDGIRMGDDEYRRLGFRPVYKPTADVLAGAILQLQGADRINNIGDVQVTGQRPLQAPVQSVGAFEYGPESEGGPTIVTPPARGHIPHFYGPESEGGPRTIVSETRSVPSSTPTVSSPTVISPEPLQEDVMATGANTSGGYFDRSLGYPKRDLSKMWDATTPWSSMYDVDDEPPLKLEPWMTDEEMWTAKPGTRGAGGDRGSGAAKEPGKLDWNDIVNGIGSLVPYFRPSDVEGLDPRQILGELSALSDKEEPVQAQKFSPRLGSPYRVSLDDMMNEITAQTRGAQRLAGANPAAQAHIASQAYDATNKIKGEEFRMNQAMMDKVYGENRDKLDRADLENLKILDQQYERQSRAKSATKALLREALGSISEKYMKNQLENRTLATYENLHNYRFDPRFRAWSHNAPVAWDMTGSGESAYGGYTDMDERIMRYEEDPKTGKRTLVGSRPRTKSESTETTKKARNGALVRAMKGL